MSIPKNLREASKVLWTNPNPSTTENITLGAILRIADAVELMAKNYTTLQDTAERYKRWYEEERKVTKRLANRNRGLRGTITRLKNRRHK